MTTEISRVEAQHHVTEPHPYIPLTPDDRDAMLATIGAASIGDLFADVPAAYRNPRIDIPDALTELELLDEMRTLAARNRTAENYACFLGAGAYRHFRPSLIDPILMRGEFLTSYTPYQPEVSQGTLQTIFEFQSLVCELTGMDVANAGMYDGASALAEACLMACAVTGRRRVAVSERVHPNWLAVVKGYAQGRDIAVDVMPHPASGDAFPMSNEHACLAVAQPDFSGRMSLDAAAWGDAAACRRARCTSSPRSRSASACTGRRRSTAPISSWRRGSRSACRCRSADRTSDCSPAATRTSARCPAASSAAPSTSKGAPATC